jgi:hypothetical protein
MYTTIHSFRGEGRQGTLPMFYQFCQLRCPSTNVYASPVPIVIIHAVRRWITTVTPLQPAGIPCTRELSELVCQGRVELSLDYNMINTSLSAKYRHPKATLTYIPYSTLFGDLLTCVSNWYLLIYYSDIAFRQTQFAKYMTVSRPPGLNGLERAFLIFLYS